MADVTNTIGTVSAENKTFYEKALLKRLTPELVYAKYGQKKSAPRNEGTTVNFRRFNAIAPKTTALTEGVTPDGSALTVTTVTATVNQYGDFVRVSDVLDMTGIDPVITEMAQVLGESAGLAVDSVVRDVVLKGTSVQYAGGADSRDKVVAGKTLTTEEIRKAVRTLRCNHAKPLDGRCYIGIVDPETAYDLMNDSLWQDVSKYNGGQAIMDGEIGRLCGVRFVETGNGKTISNGASTGAINLHQTMIIGADAYGTVDIAGSSHPEIIIKGTESGGTADPLNQRGTIGRKAMFTAVRLQELALVRIEHAVSA